jgi:uncharacterized RDD family membrane protein YckC
MTGDNGDIKPDHDRSEDIDPRDLRSVLIRRPRLPSRRFDSRESSPSHNRGADRTVRRSHEDDRTQYRGAERRQPPVWPGDDKQPWFRRERGEQSQAEYGDLDRGSVEFPTGAAELNDRAAGLAISTVIPFTLGFIPVIGYFINIAFILGNLFLFQRGQDVGAVAMKLRVVRENGDVAGFFHMWTRNLASVISALALGAGFWTAYSDPERRTWHDKMMGTYVVKDDAEYNLKPRSSSPAARSWFWISILLFVVAPALIYLLASAPVPEQ